MKKLMTIIALAAVTAVTSAPAFAQPMTNRAAAYQQEQTQYSTGGDLLDWVYDHAKGPIGGR